MSPTDTAVATASVSTDIARAPHRPRRWRTRLRGRQHWLMLGCLLGALAGAAAGWLSGQSFYRSSVLLEVDPLLPALDNPAERRTAEALIDKHLARQAQLLKSQTLPPPATGLVVERSTMMPRTLEVSVLATDPVAGAEALRHLIDNYQAAQSEEQRSIGARLSDATARKRETEAAISRIHRQLAEQTSAFGPVPLEQVTAARAEELRRVDDLIAQTRTALATAVTPAGDEPRQESDGLPLAELRTLARNDAVLAGLLDDRRQVEDRLSSLRRRMGPNAPAVRTELDRLDRIDDAIRDHLRTAAAAPVPAGEDGESALLLTAPQLRERLERLQERRRQLVADVASVQEHRLAADRLQNQADDAVAQLRGIDEQIDRLTLQQQIGGTITVTEPIVSTRPHRETRMARALMGGGAGIVAGMALVTLALLADNRIRRPDRAALDDPATPLFGAVPTVNPAALSGDDADSAALCIHEIRALMQLRARSHGARAFAITSPSRGAGKTSLTVGLASSLALSGTRTLLVDCDLTRRSNRGEPDRQGRSNAHDPTHKDADPNASHHLDQVMLQMGYLDDTDPEVLLLSHDASIGITGLLEGKPLPHCVVETSVPGLAVLPALAANSQHIARMSSAFIRRLVDEAKRDYDMIVFDTGPVPGSVEALVVTGEADAVILVVARGEKQSRFDRAVAYLRMVGANLAGTVFNRAAAHDLTIEAAAKAAGADKGKADKRAGAPHRPAAAQRITGSGLLAAAVHAQSNQTISNPGRPASRAEAARRRTPPQPAASPTPATPRRDANPDRPRPQQPDPAADDAVSLADAGDIAAILNDGPRPASRPAAQSPPPPRQRPEFPVADADLEDALDQLVNDARKTQPPPLTDRDLDELDDANAAGGPIPMHQPRRRAAGGG